MNNILITGGAGYIGTVLSNLLIKKKKNVVVIDNLSTSTNHYLNKKVIFFKKDISNLVYIKKIIQIYKIDTVIHLASKKSVVESLKFPQLYFDEIYINSIKIFNLAKKNKVINFIFSSTAAVYGSLNRQTLDESNSCKPISNYGKLKLKVEKYIKRSCTNKNFPKMKVIVLRFFNVVGADYPYSGPLNFNDGSLFNNICLSLKNNKKLPLFGNRFNTLDGYCIRDFIHVLDLCEIILKTLKKISLLRTFSVFNLGYSKGYSVKQVVKSFEKNSKKKIICILKKPREGEVEVAIAKNDKIKKYLNSLNFKFNNINLLVNSHYHWFKKFYYKKSSIK